MKTRQAALRAAGILGAVIAYGCLAAFLYLIGVQLFRWFRQGEWTHIGVGDGLRISLTHCCLKEDGSGRIAGFLQWWDSPVTWLGLHKVFELVPASLALFAVSIAGNSLFIYCRDRLQARDAPVT